jgi:hypothetical protein
MIIPFWEAAEPAVLPGGKRGKNTRVAGKIKS